MQAGKGKFPRVDMETKPCAERRGSFDGECRENPTHSPKLGSKRKFIRKGVTLHKQCGLPQSQRVRGTVQSKSRH